MKKILLCGMKYDFNFGDSIINSCCKKIVEQIIEDKKMYEYEINEIDLSGKKLFTDMYYIDKTFKYYINRCSQKIINKIKTIFKRCNFNKIYNWLDLIEYYFSLEYMIMKKYYINEIQNSDIIIFAGGGFIKYKYQNCYHYIDEVTKVANKKNIPVCLNAVGVEGYDENNIKCRLLKKALNRQCIKMITTRDDINKLKKYIDKKENIFLNKVSDIAVYADVVYKKEKMKNTNYIGLGVCRGNLFIDNNIKYSKEQLLKLWKEIIYKLEEKNINWKIYTNGLEADNEFAIDLFQSLKKNNYTKEKLIFPKSPEELIDIISSFKGIIATRLHSNIIAYSLKIPAIGLVWNDKLKMFGESIQYPERYFEVKDFNANKIVESLERAIEEGYSKISPEDYRKTVKEELERFLVTYYK